MKEYKLKLDAEEVEILLAIDPNHHFPDWSIEDAIVCGLIKQIQEQEEDEK